MSFALAHTNSDRHEECRFRELLIVIIDRAIQDVADLGPDRPFEVAKLSSILTRFFDSVIDGHLEHAAVMRNMFAAELEKHGIPAAEVVRLERNALVELFALINIRFRNSGKELELVGNQFLVFSNTIFYLQVSNAQQEIAGDAQSYAPAARAGSRA